MRVDCWFDLHEIVKGFNPGIQELGTGIQAVAAEAAQPLLVDDEPRLLIDGRDPRSLPHVHR